MDTWSHNLDDFRFDNKLNFDFDWIISFYSFTARDMKTSQEKVSYFLNVVTQNIFTPHFCEPQPKEILSCDVQYVN